MSYTVLARKWRPKNFAQLVGQQHVMQALANALDQQRLHHAYLFTGTRGVGKTTIARIFSKALNCEQGISSSPCGSCSSCKSIDEGRFADLIEVDAASKTKVEDTRELLENIKYAPVQGRFKVYLIDEVHMLSKSSFNALLKTLEEPPEHVKFLLATTDPHKLPVTVLSRCLQFNLVHLTQEQIKLHLIFILEQENIVFTEDALQLIAKSAAGSVRDSLSILDQAIAFGAGEVSFEAVKSMLGLVDQQYVVDIILALLNGSADEILEIIKQLSLTGVDYEALNDQLAEVLHQIMMLQVLGALAEQSLIEKKIMDQAAKFFSPDKVQSLFQICLLAKQDMKLAPDVRIGFEMCLLRMLAFEPSNISETHPKNNKNSEQLISTPNKIIKHNLQPNSIYEPKKITQSEYLKKLQKKINQSLGKTQEAIKPKEIIEKTTPPPSVIDDEFINWQQIINQLELQGLEADLANNSILVEHTDSKLVLSADPEKIKGLDLAIEKLQLILKQKLGYDLVFIESEQPHLTPHKVKLNKQVQIEQSAKQNIYNDEQVKNFTQILNMEIIDSSIIDNNKNND